MKIFRSKIPRWFFSKKEKNRIVSAIQEAEQKTSGEIRVHLCRKSQGDIIAEAKKTFEKMGMTQTEARNGILIFFCVASRQFAILGDSGIHEKVPPNFWNSMIQNMSISFKEDRFADGLCHVIGEMGEKLKTCFPHETDDLNELSNHLSYSR